MDARALVSAVGGEILNQVQDDKGSGQDDKGSGQDDKGSGQDDKGSGQDDKGSGQDDRESGQDDGGKMQDDRGKTQDDEMVGRAPPYVMVCVCGSGGRGGICGSWIRFGVRRV